MMHMWAFLFAVVKKYSLHCLVPSVQRWSWIDVSLNDNSVRATHTAVLQWATWILCIHQGQQWWIFLDDLLKDVRCATTLFFMICIENLASLMQRRKNLYSTCTTNDIAQCRTVVSAFYKQPQLLNSSILFVASSKLYGDWATVICRFLAWPFCVESSPAGIRTANVLGSRHRQ